MENLNEQKMKEGLIICENIIRGYKERKYVTKSPLALAMLEEYKLLLENNDNYKLALNYAKGNYLK